MPLGPRRVVRLSTHKQNAITSTLPKLPRATDCFHSIHNATKDSILNRQIGSEKLVPSLSNTLHTYRGDLHGTCLQDGTNKLRTSIQRGAIMVLFPKSYSTHLRYQLIAGWAEV